jgi:maltose O-acetyltransferase
VHDASTRRHIGYSVVAPVRIGRRVYIGAGAVILPGVTIGDDAIVGAGAVVRHDVPAGMVAVGVPARVVTSTEEYVGQHRAQLGARPTYEAEGYTAAGNPTDATRRQMQRELADGHGYVR